ncbi:hypothetical protein DQY68_25605 [Salmonella enterica subsp. salamae]|nr:hypothetical protein [Salmonella enterica subsp. salamae]
MLNGAITSGNHRRRSALARSVYGAAVQQALIVLWEASDRLCSKRLKALLLQLIPAMEKHGHLSLNPALRGQLLKVIASSIDRLLKEAHTTAGKKRNRAVSRVSKSIPVRMLTEHERHSPGFMEMDLVAHCGQQTRSRLYRKNDQAWIEQKNGAVVRKLAGYGRLDGEPAVKR